MHQEKHFFDYCNFRKKRIIEWHGFLSLSVYCKHKKVYHKEDIAMNKLFVLLLLITVDGELDVEVQDKGEINKSDNGVAKKSAYEIAVENWLQDSRTLQKIAIPLRKYKLDYNDTDLMREEKKRQLFKVLESINKKYANTILELSCVRCEDVKEEEVLTAYGKKKTKK